MIARVTIFVPLGRDLKPEGLDVCGNTVIRYKTAEKLAWEDEDGVVMVAPGCDRDDMPCTMAALMHKHRSALCLIRVFNRDDRRVWGTLGEMVWCVNYARRYLRPEGTNYRFVFVTTPRHGRRVRFIRDLFAFFKDEDITTYDADDEQISLLKEVALAYPKLLFLKLVEWCSGDATTFKLPILQAKRSERPSLGQLRSILKRR